MSTTLQTCLMVWLFGCLCLHTCVISWGTPW